MYQHRIWAGTCWSNTDLDLGQNQGTARVLAGWYISWDSTDLELVRSGEHRFELVHSVDGVHVQTHVIFTTGDRPLTGSANKGHVILNNLL